MERGTTPSVGHMAFLRLAFFPRGTAEQWAAVVQAVDDIPPPEAGRAFAAGPVDDGWQVMQLWDNREDLEGFNRAVFFPAIADPVSTGSPKPRSSVTSTPPPPGSASSTSDNAAPDQATAIRLGQSTSATRPRPSGGG